MGSPGLPPSAVRLRTLRMSARAYEASAWVILLSVIGTAAYQGNDWSTTVPECVGYGCLLGLSVFCAYLGIGDDDGPKPKQA
jgi:hypothetical protein